HIIWLIIMLHICILMLKGRWSIFMESKVAMFNNPALAIEVFASSVAVIPRLDDLCSCRGVAQLFSQRVCQVVDFPGATMFCPDPHDALGFISLNFITHIVTHR